MAERELSAEVFKYWVHNYREGTLRIVTQDGRDVIESMPDGSYPKDTAIAISVFDWENWWVMSLTDRNETIISEVYSPAHDALKGRPVVYLDQNHWSSLRHTLTDPTDSDESRAGRRLMDLAQDGGVTLPLSSAHLGETAALYDEPRYALGITMATLAGGWQMRHPLRVWRQEMAQMIRQRVARPINPSSQAPVITLEPGAWMSADDVAFDMDPRDIELFQRALIAPSVTVSMLLDPERIDRDPDALRTWTEIHQRITEELNRKDLHGDARRKAAELSIWTYEVRNAKDLIVGLGVSVEEIEPFRNLREIRKALRPMPMVSRLFELMVQRHTDKNTKWKQNDLTDLLFLCCAAGYADYVVAESHTGSQLHQWRRKNGDTGASIHTSLAELVEQLDADGVRTVTERGTSAHATTVDEDWQTSMK